MLLLLWECKSRETVTDADIAAPCGGIKTFFEDDSSAPQSPASERVPPQQSF